MTDVATVPAQTGLGRLRDLAQEQGLMLPGKQPAGFLSRLGQRFRGNQGAGYAGWFYPRAMFSRLAGGSFAGSRDFYGAFGWDYKIETAMVWKMYARGGIARTIAHAYGDATWANPPNLTPQQGAKASWVNAWEQIVEDQNVWSLLSKVDTLGQIGPYCIAVVGVKGAGPLNEPMPPGPFQPSDLLYIQPFSNRSAVITKWGTDPTQERFGLPLEYAIYPGLARTEDILFGAQSIGQPMQIPNQGSFKVHWSRCMHFAIGALEQEIFGVPLMWTVWNHLTDLQKVIGGAAESYWMTANRGLHIDVDKDLDLESDDEAALSEEVDEYTDGLRRVIRTRGVTINDLGSEVANPDGPFNNLISLIAGTTRIPNRVLLGAESAHMSSTQDKGTWAERRVEYRELTAKPHLLKPMLICLKRMGFLPNTVLISKLKQEWPDPYYLSPLEFAQAANQRSAALSNMSLAVGNVPNLMTVEEMRENIGLMPKKPEGTDPAPPVLGKVTKGTGDSGQAVTGDDGTVSTPLSDAGKKGDQRNPRGSTDR